MSNRSRRILYRAGFLTLCLFPTLALAGWIVNDRVMENGGPISAADTNARPLAEAELSRLLGLKVTLDRITYAASGQTILDGMAIADPETGARIAFIPVLEMSRGANGLVMTATRPEIESTHWGALWETLNDCVLRERGEPITVIDLTASQVSVVSSRPEHAPTLTDVHVRLEPGKAAFKFHLAGIDAPSPATFHVTRDRTTSPPVSRCELHTGGELPCVLFAEQLPWLAHLGERAVFDGSLWFEDPLGDSRGEASGRVNHIDLARLLGARFRPPLSGEAALTLNQAEFEGSRLRAAAGAVDAGPGTIGRDLLGAAFEHLGLRYTPELPAAVGDYVRYDQLRFGFTIDEGGLSLRGQCDSEGTILSVEKNPQARILDQPAQVAQVVSLVRMLTPAGEPQVAASRETEALLRVLPLPALTPTPPQSGAAPQARVRLRD